MLLSHRETHWSRTRRWIVLNFQLLIVTVVKTCTQWVKTASASGGPQTRYPRSSPLNPKWKFLVPPLCVTQWIDVHVQLRWAVRCKAEKIEIDTDRNETWRLVLLDDVRKSCALRPGYGYDNVTASCTIIHRLSPSLSLTRTDSNSRSSMEHSLIIRSP